MIMAGGTGGHIFPALAVADYLRARELERGVARRARRAWRRGSCRSTATTWRGSASPGCAARASLAKRPAAAQSAGRVLAERARDLRASSRRRARHGRLRRVSRRHDGSAPQPPARDPRAELDRRAREPRARQASPTGCSRRFPGAFGRTSRRRTGNPVRERSSHIAPPDERFAGRTGPSAAARRRRQPGRARAERGRAGGARAAARGRAAAGHAPGGRGASRGAARSATATRGVAAEVVRVHRRHGARLRRRRSRHLPRRRVHVAELAAAGVASVLVPFPHRGGRSPDAQRALPRRARRRAA